MVNRKKEKGLIIKKKKKMETLVYAKTNWWQIAESGELVVGFHT